MVLMVRSSDRIRIPRSKRRGFLKRDKEGVASTVGTIMALLVFLAFLGLFTNTYIPIWMLDNEHEHMNEVMNEFGEFKARIASLIVNYQTTGLTSIIMYTPITLGAAGVPIFASPTIGQLDYEPSGTTNSSGVSIDFAYDTGGGIVNVNNSGGGKLELYAPNRYYVQQWVAYENGALLVRQTDGQSMRAAPSINVNLMASGKVNLTFTQIDFIGLNSSYSGTGSVGATTQLKYLDYQYYSSDQLQGEVRMTFVTMYNSSWMSFLSDICSSAGLVEGATGNYTLTDTQVTDEIHRVVFTIMDCGSMIYNRAYVSTTIKF
jgi:hypothetical protein